MKKIILCCLVVLMVVAMANSAEAKSKAKYPAYGGTACMDMNKYTYGGCSSNSYADDYYLHELVKPNSDVFTGGGAGAAFANGISLLNVILEKAIIIKESKKNKK